VTWPQFYVLAAMIISSAIGIVAESRDRDNSSVYIATYVVILLATRVAMALVLHAGGFW
jgi:hypothetical protein